MSFTLIKNNMAFDKFVINYVTIVPTDTCVVTQFSGDAQVGSTFFIFFFNSGLIECALRMESCIALKRT